MSILKFKDGPKRPGTSGKNVDYITRDSACESLSFHNLDELKTDDPHETKLNAKTYAYAREDIERAMKKGSITHYRMILSWPGKEDTEKAREITHKFLQKEFPNTRAIVAIHQDTSPTHAHVWIDARQIDEKKVQIKPTQYKRLDEKYTKFYDREYGTNYAPGYKASKEQTLQHNREEFAEGKRTGKREKPPNKPPRAKDKLNSKFYREKDARDLGVKINDQARTGANHRPFEIRNSQVERTEREIEQRESTVKREVTQLAQGVDEYRQQIETGKQQLDRAELKAGEQSERTGQIFQRIDGLHRERNDAKEVEKERNDYER